jgi:hypothetical protein
MIRLDNKVTELQYHQVMSVCKIKSCYVEFYFHENCVTLNEESARAAVYDIVTFCGLRAVSKSTPERYIRTSTILSREILVTRLQAR